MTSNVSVSVFVDRMAALRAGRNRWGWVTTQLDLDGLTAAQREMLGSCAERDGVLYLTQVQDAPDFIGRSHDHADDFWSSTLEKTSREAFSREWHGAAPISEASSKTALAALIFLATRRERRLAQALQDQATLQARATAMAAESVKDAREAIAGLEAWLATPAVDLVIEDPAQRDANRRFQIQQPPRLPELSVPYDDYGRGGTGEADFRELWFRVARVIVSKGQYEEPIKHSWNSFMYRRTENEPVAPTNLPPPPTLREAGQRVVNAAWAEHQEAITRLTTEAERLCRAKQHHFEHLQRIAELARMQADEARRVQAAAAREKADLTKVLAWAIEHGRQALVQLIQDNATPEVVINQFRAEVFDAIEQHTPKHRKMTKSDLLIANPALRNDERALDTKFGDADTSLASSEAQSAFTRISQDLVAIDIPAQYRVRRHRGQLLRRGEAVGEALEATSLLVMASLGSIAVSRAFCLEAIAPVTATSPPA